MAYTPPDNTIYTRIGLPALITATVIYGLFFIPWLVLAGLLFLSFTPFETPFTHLTICVYPLLTIGCLAASFVLYRKNRYQAAFFILFLPLFDICLLLVAYAAIWP